MIRAGRVDVDAAMDEVTPQQMAELEAYYEVDGDPWERLFTILVRGFQMMSMGEDMKPEHIDPWYKEPEQSTGIEATIAAAEKATAQLRSQGGHL